MVRDVTIIMSALRTTSATKERVQVMKLFAPTYALKMLLEAVRVNMTIQPPANIFAVLVHPVTATITKTILVSEGTTLVIYYASTMMEPNLFLNKCTYTRGRRTRR